MEKTFEAIPVAQDIYWVGAIDWNIRNFHGYATHRGTTYNAYLVLADKPVLIDTVKKPFRDELLERVSSVIDPKDIAYIVSNHSEMDHSGCLAEVMDIVQPEKTFASVMGKKALEAHFRMGDRITAVKDGEKLDLGNREIQFFEARMLHWPDSMHSYLTEEQILFSNDGFGMHLASYERFADELPFDMLEYEAKKYFANILLPYSGIVLTFLEKVAQSGIGISMIAPDHGPVWRREEDVRKIVGLWKTWALQKPARKAVVVYDSMWQSTDLMARAIGEGLTEGGVEALLMSMSASHRSDVATEVLDAGALVAGSPTLNNTMFPTLPEVLVYLRGLRPKNLIGAAFGSYGWGGEAVSQLEGMLGDMKTEPFGENVRIQYVPDDAGLARCREFGKKIATKVIQFCQTSNAPGGNT
jgi:flavorubredoxin